MKWFRSVCPVKIPAFVVLMVGCWGLNCSAQTSTNRFVKKNLKEVQQFAEVGDREAQNELGYRHATATGQAPKTNYVEAAKWFRKAAEPGAVANDTNTLGLAEAQNNLGNLYLQGRGVPQDFVEAVKWLRMAAEQDFVQAQYILAKMYANGKGVEANPAEALTWFRRAAEQGDQESQYSLGLLYFNSEGATPDYLIEAYKWFNLSAAQGNTNAIRMRIRLNTTLDPEELKEAQRRSTEYKESLDQRQGPAKAPPPATPKTDAP